MTDRNRSAPPCAVSLVALLFDRDTTPSLPLVYAVLWAVVESAFVIARAIWILERVLRIASVGDPA
jgi:hypothetical protein